MPCRILVLLRAEYDDYAETLSPDSHGDRAVRSNSLGDGVPFDLKLKLSFQVPADHGFLVLKHPPVVALLTVQPYTNPIEGVRAATIVGGQFQGVHLGCI